MRFAINDNLLGLGVQVESVLGGQVAVDDQLDVSGAQICSEDVVLHDRGWSLQVQCVESLSQPNPNLIVKIALIPLAVDPQLSSGRSNLDLMRDPVQDKVSVLLVVQEQGRNDGGVFVQDDTPGSLGLETELSDISFAHDAGRRLLVETDLPLHVVNGNRFGGIVGN